MAKWIRLAGNQYLGFWLLGLVLFAVQEIPYMLMPLFRLETNPIMNMTEASEALDICEKVLGVLCIILMIFVVHKDAKLFSVSDDREKVCFTFALILLLANFAGWALYFTVKKLLTKIKHRCIIRPSDFGDITGRWPLPVWSFLPCTFHMCLEI